MESVYASRCLFCKESVDAAVLPGSVYLSPLTIGATRELLVYHYAYLYVLHHLYAPVLLKKKKKGLEMDFLLVLSCVRHPCQTLLRVGGRKKNYCQCRLCRLPPSGDELS